MSLWLPAYDRGMRHAQRGGYTPGEQRRREQVRLQFSRCSLIAVAAAGLLLPERFSRCCPQPG